MLTNKLRTMAMGILEILYFILLNNRGLCTSSIKSLVIFPKTTIDEITGFLTLLFLIHRKYPLYLDTPIILPLSLSLTIVEFFGTKPSGLTR